MEATDWVCLSQLNRWSDNIECHHPHAGGTNCFNEQNNMSHLMSRQTHANPVFPCDSVLNSKIALWRGNILKLDIDALVHPTNERFDRCTRMTGQLYKRAGPQLLRTVYNHIKHCRTGSVKITPGYSLLARYILHTAAPQYKHKYRTASENALFNCYKNVLLAARKCRFRTLALCPIAIPQHNYPQTEVAHLGIRVLRRFLERFSDSFDLIVFVVNSRDDYQLYELMLQTYFPRNSNEERAQCFTLPANVGGRMGEPIRPERGIRIKKNPIKALHTAAAADNQWYNTNCSNYANGQCCSDDDYDYDNDDSDNSLVNSIGNSNFARMEDSLDKKHHQMLTKSGEQQWGKPRTQSLVSIGMQISKLDSSVLAKHDSTMQLNERDQQLKHEYRRQFHLQRLQRKCRLLLEDNDHMLALLQRCIFSCGEDHSGRQVLVVIGARFQAQIMCNELTLYYVSKLMERTIGNKSYIIVYFHGGVSESNLPTTKFLTQLEELLSLRQRINLQSIFIVQSTMWSRIHFWWLKTFQFKSSSHQEKINFLNRIDQLKEILPDYSLQTLMMAMQ